jgi:peptide/nickel transport system substrate-binding protein
VTGRVAGKSIDIVRNPNWDRSTDYRPAYLDEIAIQEGNDDLATASRRALNASASICCDTAQPPAQVLKQALTHNKDQVLFAPAGGVHYISMNTTVKPFDNINIRKAIIAASDREALRLTTGGAVSGGLASGWLPPGLPGYDEAGGPKQDADLDYLKNPKGDPAVAKKYMLAAKQQDPSLPIDAGGKWTGSEKVLTIAGNADPAKKTSEVFQNQMEQLGFKTPCSRSSATCRPRTSRSARASAGSGTSPTRSRCSTRRSTARTSSSRATSTGPSSTCRPSTPQ